MNTEHVQVDLEFSSCSAATSPTMHTSLVGLESAKRMESGLMRLCRHYAKINIEHVYDDLALGNCRVFELVPGNFSDDIHIILRTQKLKEGEPQTYKALSYVWGSEKDPQQIWVQSQEGHKTHRPHTSSYINATRNLDEALRYIRRSDTRRLLWVDAVCINQKDTTERSEQVQQMPLIYRSAAHVVVWLGPAADESDRVMKTFGNWAEVAEYDQNNDKLLAKKQYASEYSWIEDRRQPFPSGSRLFKSCRALIERAWFERLWIRQEIYLSSHKATVVCGTWSLPWNEFRVGLMVYSRRAIDHSTPDLERALERQVLVTYLLLADQSLFYVLLYTAWGSACSDPRDKVFGILGMLREEEAELATDIKPDYTMSVVELYKRVAETCFKLYKRLDILGCYHVAADTLWRPTWVPNWAGPRDASGVVRRQYADLAMLAPGPKVSGDVLMVKGVRVARIADVESIKLSKYTSFDDLATELKRLYARFVGGSPGDGSDLLESMSYALTQDNVREHEVHLVPEASPPSITVITETLRRIIDLPLGTYTGLSDPSGMFKQEVAGLSASI